MGAAVTENMSVSANRDFGGFYEEWFDKVYNYARHRADSPTRADEIVADTFTRAFKSWSGFDPAKGDRRTWLFAIATRAVADHYRSERRRGWFSLGLFPEPREKGGPAEDLESRQEHRRLMKAMDGLGDEAREIVSLRFFGGMTNRAIAELLSLTESNVAVILFRSIRKMRGSFPEAEAEHE